MDDKETQVVRATDLDHNEDHGSCQVSASCGVQQEAASPGFISRHEGSLPYTFPLPCATCLKGSSTKSTRAR